MDLLNSMQNLNIDKSDKDKSPLFFKSIGAEIEGISTEIVYAEFTDKLFLTVTQFQKLGSLVVVERVQNFGGDTSQEIIYDTRIIFGSDTTENHVAGRYLAGQLLTVKPFYLFICLKDYKSDVLKAIKDILKDLLEN